MGILLLPKSPHGEVLIDKAVGRREAGSSLLDGLDRPCAKSMTGIPQRLFKNLQNDIPSRIATLSPCNGRGASYANIISPEGSATSGGQRSQDPHYARLIRWLAVRPRCMSSVVQMLVAGAHTYLAELASSRHITINHPWSGAFNPMTSYGMADSPIEAWPFDDYACMTWSDRMIALYLSKASKSQFCSGPLMMSGKIWDFAILAAHQCNPGSGRMQPLTNLTLGHCHAQRIPFRYHLKCSRSLTDHVFRISVGVIQPEYVGGWPIL